MSSPTTLVTNPTSYRVAVNPEQAQASLPSTEIRGVQNTETPRDVGPAREAMREAGEAAFQILPTITVGGFSVMLNSGHGDYHQIGQGIGFVTGVAGLILDPLKAVVAAPAAVGFTFQGAWRYAKSLLGHHADAQQIEQIRQSGQQRFESTVSALLTLGLETPERLQEVIARCIHGPDQDYLDLEAFKPLIAMTLLNSAFASRHLADDAILLANGNKLHKKHCPRVGRALFDAVVAAKNQLRALHLQEQTDEQLGLVLGAWLTPIYTALRDQTPVTGPDGTPSPVLQELVATLREAADQASHLDESRKKQCHDLAEAARQQAAEAARRHVDVTRVQPTTPRGNIST